MNLLSVLLGGLLAISGGVIGQIITHRLTKSRESETLRRRKGEEFVKALFDHMSWIEEKRTTMVMNLKSHDSPPPLDQARMIQRLYFPELASELSAVAVAYLPMLEFLHEQYIAHLKDESNWLISWDTKRFGELYKPLNSSVEAATEKCRQILFTSANA